MAKVTARPVAVLDGLSDSPTCRCQRVGGGVAVPPSCLPGAIWQVGSAYLVVDEVIEHPGWHGRDARLPELQVSLRAPGQPNPYLTLPISLLERVGTHRPDTVAVAYTRPHPRQGYYLTPAAVAPEPGRLHLAAGRARLYSASGAELRPADVTEVVVALPGTDPAVTLTLLRSGFLPKTQRDC